MHNAYRIATSLVAPLLPLWLLARQLRGKEDPRRRRERFGYASKPRPKGTLLWMHAASVGEANSVLPLIEKIRERFPQLQLLLTTGTVTSARLMQARLPKGVIHQYAPLDTREAARRFIIHWKPGMAFFVESEFWPNMVAAANDFHCFMGVINARMSERSYASWKKYPGLIEPMMQAFDVMFAQSEDDARRLRQLGAKQVFCPGNLKYDAPALPCDEAELLRLKSAIGARPLWLAASTHPGEEARIKEAHALLSATRPNLLTIIAPRHPQRGAEIARTLGEGAMLRSKKAAITVQTRFYIADTLGELGLFYRLSPLAFLGGSLANRGGQNPLEAARLSCAIVAGPHTHNFSDIYRDLEKAGGVATVNSAAELAARIDNLLNQPEALHAMQANARQWVESQGGASERMLAMLKPVFEAAPVAR
jgi:3-deoxy-D-manno-octulosonic-acid transferase